MILCKCQRSRSFSDLDLRSLGLNASQHFQTTSPLKPFGPFQSNFICSICSNGHGHLTNMAPMPIYGKNCKTYSPPEPLGWFPWNLISISWLSTAKFLQMVTPGWPWLIFVKVKFGPLGYWMGKRWYIAFFKSSGGLWSERRYYMNLCEYQRSRSFSDLGWQSLELNVCQLFQTTSPLKLLGQF